MSRTRIRLAAIAAAPAIIALPSPASAVGPGMIGLGAHNCAVLSASPTAQAGLGSVEGTGFITCATASEADPVLFTLTVCAQRAEFFRPTKLMWMNGDQCTTWTSGLDMPRWAESLDDSVPCGPVPLYRTYSYATVSGVAGVIEDTSEERPSACV